MNVPCDLRVQDLITMVGKDQKTNVSLSLRGRVLKEQIMTVGEADLRSQDTLTLTSSNLLGGSTEPLLGDGNKV